MSLRLNNKCWTLFLRVLQGLHDLEVFSNVIGLIRLQYMQNLDENGHFNQVLINLDALC